MPTPLHPVVRSWLRHEYGPAAGSAPEPSVADGVELSPALTALAIEDWPDRVIVPDYCIDELRAPRTWLKDMYEGQEVSGVCDYLLSLGWVLLGLTGGCGDWLLVKNEGHPTIGFGHMPILMGHVDDRSAPDDGGIVESSIDVYNLLERVMAQSLGYREAFEEGLYEGELLPSHEFLPSCSDAWSLRDEETGVAMLPPFSFAQRLP